MAMFTVFGVRLPQSHIVTNRSEHSPCWWAAEALRLHPRADGPAHPGRARGPGQGVETASSVFDR